MEERGRARRRGAPSGSRREEDDRPLVVGWIEYVDLPDWGIRGLRAKLDTGARSSAIHVENVRELPHRRVRFDVVLHRRNRDRRVHVEAQVKRRGRVRSSSGHYTSRLFVTTQLRLGPRQHEIELSLVDREEMIHRMLLGRSALEGHYLVDVGHRALLGKPERRRRPRRARTHDA